MHAAHLHMLTCCMRRVSRAQQPATLPSPSRSLLSPSCRQPPLEPFANANGARFSPHSIGGGSQTPPLPLPLSTLTLSTIVVPAVRRAMCHTRALACSQRSFGGSPRANKGSSGGSGGQGARPLLYWPLLRIIKVVRSSVHGRWSSKNFWAEEMMQR